MTVRSTTYTVLKYLGTYIKVTRIRRRFKTSDIARLVVLHASPWLPQTAKRAVEIVYTVFAIS